LRKKLEEERKEEKVDMKALKPHQVHELAAAKLSNTIYHSRTSIESER
jgi:hypothetical protein